MIFDQLAKAVESHDALAYWLPILRKSRLFVYEEVPHQSLPRVYDPQLRQWYKENFFLPFQVTAVEDPASCVVLIDRDENTRGLKAERVFIECIVGTQNRDAFRERVPLPLEKGFVALVVGVIWVEEFDERSQMLIGGSVNQVYTIKGDDISVAVPPPGPQSPLVNPATAIQEIMVFCGPDHYLVESTPLSVINRKPRPLKAGQTPRIARAHEQPNYILLKPNEIKDRFGLSNEGEGGHASPRPHSRRAHIRTLRSPKFTHKQGHVIVVKPAWIGPREKIVGNRRYRIVPDKLWGPGAG
jgi:hypothetical protein